MRGEQESYAKEFIEGMRQSVRCHWCGRDEKKNRKGLCRHCNNVRKDLESIEKLADDPSEPKTFMLDWELRIARQQQKDCMAWGQMLHGILDGPVECLELEHWFRRVAESIARDKRMHYGMANTLCWIFSAEQRQVLAYLLWEVFGAEASHNRKGRALSRVAGERRRTDTNED
jgi:hypothetical protein